ncbi:helix-turn-helix domain-containing protein [Paenibacillus sp. IB182496]|uniref:Helix-turn-helix domain-containing protein n=1 Tax=Paenibacillus sabuli TaxID=2772509 RepID=A0A927GV89_9BACL|nr:helix-turn-helix domain-containing protein [Paenibacillus sabuli]MBD2848507.1 helix-turn-helix domain-containing protein [Paenibacillus sabuli]
MNDSLLRLLEHAEIRVLAFDHHVRREIGIYKRTLSTYYMMTYIKRGSAQLRVGEAVYPLSPGKVILIPPGLEHDQFKDRDDETELLWWHFTYRLGNQLDIMALFDLPFVYEMDRTEAFEQAFSELMKPDDGPGAIPAALYRKAKRLEILSLLLGSALGKGAGAVNPAVTAPFLSLLYRMTGQSGKAPTLKQLARELHLNDAYASVRFKQLFGTSPVVMQRRIKIERAKLLLAQADLSVGEIAEELGFHELSSFSRCFKAAVGCSPMQYRKTLAAGDQPDLG